MTTETMTTDETRMEKLIDVCCLCGGEIRRKVRAWGDRASAPIDTIDTVAGWRRCEVGPCAACRAQEIDESVAAFYRHLPQELAQECERELRERMRSPRAVLREEYHTAVRAVLITTARHYAQDALPGRGGSYVAVGVHLVRGPENPARPGWMTWIPDWPTARTPGVMRRRT